MYADYILQRFFVGISNICIITYEINGTHLRCVSCFMLRTKCERQKGIGLDLFSVHVDGGVHDDVKRTLSSMLFLFLMGLVGTIGFWLECLCTLRRYFPRQPSLKL